MSELPEKQIKRLRTLIQEAETNLAAAKELLISIIGDDGQVVTPKNSSDDVTGKIIEGVFDGQMMLSPDGKNYPIPANYASKSKLVEGDLMKLTIAEDGSLSISKSVLYHESKLSEHLSSTTEFTTSRLLAANIVFCLLA